MADKQQNPVTGGNKPKPTGTNGGQSAKDKSRAASRPVAGGAGRQGRQHRAAGQGGRRRQVDRRARAPASASPGARSPW